MSAADAGPVRSHVVGDRARRNLLVLAVAGLLSLASGGFAIGFEVGLSLGWVVLTLGIAVAAGLARAGLVPTVGSLWAVGLWWFAFPPIVGYLTGSWAGTGRYSHPRMLAYGYTSARAELIGGVEQGLELGLGFALVVGVIGYATGVAIDRIVTRVVASG